MASDLQSIERAYEGLSMHDKALVVESWTEKLATEMAHAGVDKNTVQVVSKIADVFRRLVSALGQGQEQTGDSEGPPEDQAEPAAADAAAPPRDIHGATQAMHQEMIQRARAAR
jgi:hypothetical protein